MKNYSKLSEIKSTPIVRYPIGLSELDYIYGYSIFPTYSIWGMPKGKISLWSGSTGVGKSRLAIEVVKSIAKIEYPTLYSSSLPKILYALTEADEADFGGWAKDTSKYDNIYVTSESSVDEIISMIYEIRPTHVFVDSVNEIDEFMSGSKKEARRLIKGLLDSDGNLVSPGFKQVCNEIGCHLVLLGQLNQDGTIKGGTSLPHLVDIALNIELDPENNTQFTVSPGVKHRYGKKGTYSLWKHTDSGVVCRSGQSNFDEIWCKTHKLKLLTVQDIASEFAKNSKILNNVAPISQETVFQEDIMNRHLLGMQTQLLSDIHFFQVMDSL